MPSPFQRIAGVVGAHRALKLMALYPPYLGAGVVVDHVDPGLGSVTVSMALSRRNRNAMGTHFGGSLYAMCDPWLVLLLLLRLGDDFIVWDKEARVQFLRPGRGRVRATIAIDDAMVADLAAETRRLGRLKPSFTIEVVDDDGAVVTRIDKVLSIRLKNLDAAGLAGRAPTV